ncbi:MAG: M48 family metalloprotease [Deltaproteobacteria bacterium]|nr:M48 family metalloprotease [Deltaproteobacteria bacterium]
MCQTDLGDNSIMRITRIAIVAVLITVVTIRSGFPADPFSLSRINLTTKQERELGKKFMLHVRKHLVIIDDPSITGYVDRIGQHIVAQLPTSPFDFHFYVVKEDVYNAFAAPAGYVFINSGLLSAMESEEELAGILGHEIAHVLCRHISERMQQSKKIGIATLAGVLAGILLGDPALTGAMAQGSVAAGTSLALKYSRENEMEADQVGVKYLNKAGYGSEGLLKTLERIRAKRWFGPEEIPTYLSTHPAVESRMAYLDTWIQTRPKPTRPVHPGDPTDFRKVKVKLIALYGDAGIAHSTFDSQLRKDPNDALAYYGKGLVLDRDGKKEEAAEALKKALEWRPLDVDILRDLGKTYFHMGDYARALKTLRGVLASSPQDREGWFLLGRAQMETGDLNDALDSFKTLVDTAPDYLQGIYYLGETYGKLGNLGEAHYFLGVYYKEKGRFKNAKFHLNRALNLFAKDSARRLTIEKALKELSGAEVRDRNEQSAW